MNREVVETDKSLIQGTLDAGVLGGLPKYKVWMVFFGSNSLLKPNFSTIFF